MNVCCSAICCFYECIDALETKIFEVVFEVVPMHILAICDILMNLNILYIY